MPLSGGPWKVYMSVILTRELNKQPEAFKALKQHTLNRADITDCTSLVSQLVRESKIEMPDKINFLTDALLTIGHAATAVQIYEKLALPVTTPSV